MEYSEKEIQKRISAHLFNHNLDLVFTETLGAENAFAAVARQLLERSWDNAVDKLLLQSYLALAHDQFVISSFENAAQGEVARTREFAFDAIARLFRDKWYAENTQFSEIVLKGLEAQNSEILGLSAIACANYALPEAKPKLEKLFSAEPLDNYQVFYALDKMETSMEARLERCEIVFRQFSGSAFDARSCGFLLRLFWLKGTPAHLTELIQRLAINFLERVQSADIESQERHVSQMFSSVLRHLREEPTEDGDRALFSLVGLKTIPAYYQTKLISHLASRGHYSDDEILKLASDKMYKGSSTRILVDRFRNTGNKMALAAIEQIFENGWESASQCADATVWVGGDSVATFLTKIASSVFHEYRMHWSPYMHGYSDVDIRKFLVEELGLIDGNTYDVEVKTNQERRWSWFDRLCEECAFMHDATSHYDFFEGAKWRTREMFELKVLEPKPWKLHFEANGLDFHIEDGDTSAVIDAFHTILNSLGRKERFHFLAAQDGIVPCILATELQFEALCKRFHLEA